MSQKKKKPAEQSVSSKEDIRAAKKAAVLGTEKKSRAPIFVVLAVVALEGISEPHRELVDQAVDGIERHPLGGREKDFKATPSRAPGGVQTNAGPVVPRDQR